MTHGMELTRRDALAALAASGVTVGAGVALDWNALREGDVSPTDAPGAAAGDSSAASDAPVAFTEREVTTLTALARTLYPTPVTGIPGFVETYVVGRVRDRPAYANGIKRSLATLDEYATEWFDGRFGALSPTDREALLRQMGLASVAPDPVGSDPERLRYHLVNELLYALFSSPTGGTLIGIENPRGHPGGTESYRRERPRKR